jgi:DNA-binding PadR family transcriptional regulator
VSSHQPVELSLLEFHVLLALAGSPLYGYAIKSAVVAESRGLVDPRAGSLYRVLARLMTSGLVRHASSASDTPHPGLARRYYALTRTGRDALAAEAHRLKHSAALAERRLRTAEERS